MSSSNSTRPASGYSPASATWLRDPSPLVAAAMHLGLSAAEALALAAARRDETARLLALAG